MHGDGMTTQWMVRDSETGKFLGRSSVSGPLEPVVKPWAYQWDTVEDAQQAAGAYGKPCEIVPPVSNVVSITR